MKTFFPLLIFISIGFPFLVLAMELNDPVLSESISTNEVQTETNQQHTADHSNTEFVTLTISDIAFDMDSKSVMLTSTDADVLNSAEYAIDEPPQDDSYINSQSLESTLLVY